LFSLRAWVVALDEILPGEPFECLRAGIGVPRLGCDGSQVEAQGIGVVLAQEVGHLHERAAALAELATLEVEVFSDIGWKKAICLLYPTAHILMGTEANTLTF